MIIEYPIPKLCAGYKNKRWKTKMTRKGIALKMQEYNKKRRERKV